MPKRDSSTMDVSPMDMQLEKDNVPGYLIAWDDLCLNVELAPVEKEIVFAREFEKSL